MSIFGDLYEGLVSEEDVLRRRGILKSFPMNFTPTQPLDFKDRQNIHKITNLFRIGKIHRITGLEQAQLVFENTSNYLAVFNKLPGGSGWNDFIGIKGEVGRIESYEGKPDAYLSTASFVSKSYSLDETGNKLPRRTQPNIKDIVQLSQDLDFYKLGITVDQALEEVANLVKTDKVEMPNLLILSGNGLQLSWFTDNCLGLKGSGPEKLFKAIQAHFLRVFKGLESDPVVMEPSNVIRLANTVNSKNGETVRVYLLRTDRVTLGTFKDRYLPFVLPKKKGKNATKKKSNVKPYKPGTNVVRDTRLWNELTLNWARVEDIFRIVEYKQKHGENMQGMRQRLALVLRFQTLVYSDGDYDLAVQKVEEFWDLLDDREGTSLGEILRRTQTAVRYFKEWKGELPFNPSEMYPKPGLFYRNQTFVEAFELSIKCQIGLKTFKVRDKEYERVRDGMRRKEKGIKTIKEKDQSKIDQITSALAKNPLSSAREIESATGISKSTAARLIKKYGLK